MSGAKREGCIIAERSSRGRQNHLRMILAAPGSRVIGRSRLTSFWLSDCLSLESRTMVQR